MKEHKKLYKSGKNWVTATILTAAITATGLYASSPVYADNSSASQKIDQVNTAVQASGPIQTNDEQQVLQQSGTNDAANITATNRTELERQIQLVQQDVDRKSKVFQQASDEFLKLKAETDEARANYVRNGRLRRQYQQAAKTTQKLYTDTDHSLYERYNELYNKADELKENDAKTLLNKYNDEYMDLVNQQQSLLHKSHPTMEDDNKLLDLVNRAQALYKEIQELRPSVDKGKNAYEDAVKEYQDAFNTWGKFNKLHIPHIDKINNADWDTFDPSFLSDQDRLKYNNAIDIINKNQSKLAQITNDYFEASRKSDQANKESQKAWTNLQKSQSTLDALRAELASLPSGSGDSSSTSQPSDSSASSSAAKPSDSSASSSAAKPSGSSVSSSAAKPSDSSASSSAAKPSDSSASSSATKPSDSSASSSAAKPSGSSATQLNASSDVAQLNDGKVSFGAADIKSRLGAKPTQVAFVAPNSSQASNLGSNQIQKRNSLPQTGNDNSMSLIALGALTAIFGLGVVKKKQF